MKTWILTDPTPENENGNQIKIIDGNIAIATDLEALKTRINATLQVIKGELQDPEEGVDLFGIILANVPLSLKVQELSRVLKRLNDVKEVTFRKAVVNKETGALTFYLTIKSTYGDLDVSHIYDYDMA